MTNDPNTSPGTFDPDLIMIADDYLSLRTGKMSFIQYGFDADPGDGVRSFFDVNKVVLLALNDHRFVHYQFQFVDRQGEPVTPKPYSPQRDEVVILWPQQEGAPPDDLAPEKFFEFSKPARRGQGVRKWPRESFRVGTHQGEWNTALVFRDPFLNYIYEYDNIGGADDYRFYLRGQAIVPWRWRRGQAQPSKIYEDESNTLKKTIEAEAGGPQQLGGQIPYPPK